MSYTFGLSVLGARGSMPVNGKNFMIYGGATSCYRILAGNEEIYLDAGNGILNANIESATRITILLTHMHLDHIIGLPFFVALGQANRRVDIFAKDRSGLTVQEALDRLISQILLSMNCQTKIFQSARLTLTQWKAITRWVLLYIA